MGYIGQAPANKVVTTSDIEDDAITSAKIATGTVVASDLGANSVDSSELVDGSIDTSHIGASQVTDAKIADMAATKLTGSIADARVPASAVTQHVTAFDDTNLRNDIAALALHTAVSDDKVAYNLPNAMIEQFQDDSKIGTETNTDRDASEFIDTKTVAVSFWNNDGSVDATRVTGGKFGTYCLSTLGNQTDTTRWLKSNAISGLSGMPTTGDFTIEYWYKDRNRTGADRPWSINGDDGRMLTVGQNDTTQMNLYGMYTYPSSTTTTDTNFTGWTTEAVSTWTHHAIVREGSTITMYDNGVDHGTRAGVSLNLSSGNPYFYIGRRDGSAGEMWAGLMDEFRFSNNARWTADFTPPSSAYTVDANTILLNHFEDTNFADSKQTIASIHSATGTLISTANTASAAQTKVSGVMLYKDNAGTATIGTDLKIYFTCNGGTNWTEAASYGTVSPVFSTGVKMIRLGDTTCTSGTDVRYKAVWANQSTSSKETQLHGIGINY